MYSFIKKYFHLHIYILKKTSRALFQLNKTFSILRMNKRYTVHEMSKLSVKNNK